MTTESERLETDGGHDRPFTEGRAYRVIRVLIGAANPLIRRLLASRFHAPLSRNVMLLRFRGRVSGRWFSTPVGYAREGDTAVVVSLPSYRWWRNVVTEVPVQVRVRGVWFDARARGRLRWRSRV